MDEKLFEKEGGFGAAVRSFDAFPKTRPSYSVRTSRGGAMTLLITLACVLLVWLEFGVYLDGIEEQHFMVEKTIGHMLQINIDITVAMPCDTIHINVQDAVGDRILAGELLKREAVRWEAMAKGSHRLKKEVKEGEEGTYDDLWDVLGKGKKGGWGSQLGRWKGDQAKACRVYGSMMVNKVQGDFHITARGHGYWDKGAHVEHDKFNFSHVVNELSFGEFYPKLVNPMDGVVATTDEHFWRYQYFLSLVPTFYQSTAGARRHSLFTNQYAVTEQSQAVSHMGVPGIFFKFDIEPVSLAITDSRTPLLQFIVRLVNIIGGVLVSGNWFYSVYDYVATAVFRKKAGAVAGGRGGMLGTGKDEYDL